MFFSYTIVGTSAVMAAPEGSQFDTRQYDSKMTEL